MSNKKHADWQQPYRKSSNFDKTTKAEPLKPDGKGNLVKRKLTDLEDGEKKAIHDTLDDMQRNIEMVPGDKRGEEEEQPQLLLKALALMG